MEESFEWEAHKMRVVEGTKEDIGVKKFAGKIPMSNLYYDITGRVYEVFFNVTGYEGRSYFIYKFSMMMKYASVEV